MIYFFVRIYLQGVPKMFLQNDRPNSNHQDEQVFYSKPGFQSVIQTKTQGVSL